jgi:hypothetical protein
MSILALSIAPLRAQRDDGTRAQDSVHAQDSDSDVPRLEILSCQSACGKWTPPQPVDTTVHYPTEEQDVANRQAVLGTFGAGDMENQLNTESYVDLRFTVGKDGRTKDIVVEQLVGPQSFADQALKDVTAFTFKPASANGVPAEAPNQFQRIVYTYDLRRDIARNQVATGIDRAQALAQAGKFAESNEILKPLYALPRLNFYERTMIALFMAANYGQLKDFETALERIREATFSDAKRLDPKVQEFAIRTYITLAAHEGQFEEALAWFDILKARTTVAADDPAQKTVDRIVARLGNPEPLRIAGMIPENEHHAAWQTTLLRRAFAFGSVEGRVDRFQLRCDQQMIASPVNETSQWTVPDSWSNCALDVYGTAGAKFQLLESDR